MLVDKKELQQGKKTVFGMLLKDHRRNRYNSKSRVSMLNGYYWPCCWVLNAADYLCISCSVFLRMVTVSFVLKKNWVLKLVLKLN